MYAEPGLPFPASCLCQVTPPSGLINDQLTGGKVVLKKFSVKGTVVDPFTVKLVVIESFAGTWSVLPFGLEVKYLISWFPALIEMGSKDTTADAPNARFTVNVLVIAVPSSI